MPPEARVMEPTVLEREQELAACVAALERTRAGHGSIVVVLGPSGIGKTQLLQVVRSEAPRIGARALAAHGLEVQRSVAFGGIRQLLEPEVQRRPPDAVSRLFSGAARPAARLLAVDAGSQRPDPGEFPMLNALYWVVAGIAESGPLLLALDDAHWLDRPTLRLVQFLVPRIDELGVVVLLASRPPRDDREDRVLGQILADPTTHVIRPRPLSEAAVGDLVSARLGEPADPAFAAACAEAVGGNPFYLSELLRELEARRVRPMAAQAALVRGIGPESISVAVRFRSTSEPETFAFARAMAILGDGARFEHVADLAGLPLDVAARAADALVRDSILSTGPSLSFTHPIVRTAISADLGVRERAAAHERAARILRSAGAPPEQVAAHLLRSEPAANPESVATLRSAAAQAASNGAPDAATEYLRRALAEPPADAARASLLLELGRAEAASVQTGAAGHLAEAHRLATEAGTRTEAAVAAAYALYMAGAGAEAATLLAEVADELAGHDPDRALELEAEIATILAYEPGAARHLARLDRIGEDLAGASRGERMALCHLAYRRMLRATDATRAVALVERALAGGRLLDERGSESPEVATASMTLIFADRVDAARKLLDAAIAQARERGSRHGYALVSFLRSVYNNRIGALAAAEADAQESLKIISASGLPVAVAVATAELVVARVERGAVGEAVDALRDAGSVEGELPPQGAYSALISARARLRLALGETEEGLADLYECQRRNALIMCRQPAVLQWRVDAALVHRARGELDRARALAEEEMAAARDWGTPGTIGMAHRLVGLLASGEEAIAELRAAVAALAASPAQLEHARALIDLGAALRRANRRVEAREPLLGGLDLADRCGAIPLRQRAAVELAAMGVRPRRARISGLESLTASERRVAEMAANGLGNREIAQALFVTRKTIEKHLGNAFAKLEVSSRSALADRLREQDHPLSRTPGP